MPDPGAPSQRTTALTKVGKGKIQRHSSSCRGGSNEQPVTSNSPAVRVQKQQVQCQKQLTVSVPVLQLYKNS